MSVLMISCRQASELLEKKIHFGLGQGEQVRLFIHTSMCDACRAYRKHSLLLGKIIHKHLVRTGEDGLDRVTPPETLRQRILKALDAFGKNL